MSSPPTVLYIVYWGLREPLGRSLVVPALRALARRRVSAVVVSFEKAADLADVAAIEALRNELASSHVEWHPLLYHKRPTLPATALDVLHGLWVSFRASRRRRVDVVHGRTFVGGVIAAIHGRLWRRPFVYHNEGFWPDQQVEGGFWPAGGWLYRAMKAIENGLCRSAQGLLVLSRASVPVVRALAGHAPIGVVPSCIDLERFRCHGERRARRPVRLAYVGSLGGRYHIEPLGHLLTAVRRHQPSASLMILSHSPSDRIRERMDVSGAPPSTWTLETVAHESVPARLCSCSAGLFFLAPGIGALSCSPTKVGEYWACGLPVVMTRGMGDVDEIVVRERVGVLLDDLSRVSIEKAAADLLRLLEDPALADRCRGAAENHYSLERGLDVQQAVYARVAPTLDWGQSAATVSLVDSL